MSNHHGAGAVSGVQTGGELDANNVALYQCEDVRSGSVGTEPDLIQEGIAGFADGKFGRCSTTTGSVGHHVIPHFAAFPCQGTGDWTVDFWGLIPSSVSNAELIGTRAGENFSGFILLANTGSLRLLLAVNGISAWAVDSGNQTYTQSVFNHTAVERHGTNINFFINGTRVHQGTILLSDTVNYGGAGMGLGGQLTTNNRTCPAGTLQDEIRISNVARYEGNNFTPPIGPYI